MRILFSIAIALVSILMPTAGLVAAEFEEFIKPLLTKRCLKCHGGEETNAKIDFKSMSSVQTLVAKPALIKEMIEVVDANDMPPEGEPTLPQTDRVRLLASLKQILARSKSSVRPKTRVRRLNRFQYNNAVRDIFRLNRDVFALPEKLMTRETNYLQAGNQRVPDQVNVVSRTLTPAAGLSNVRAFPKDLRAAHGFDNQANQLTLSPLLLDSFLRLSVSIVESPDFNQNTVGIWHDFFRVPVEFEKVTDFKSLSENARSKLDAEITNRLRRFLSLTFRRPIESDTLGRYTAYLQKKLDDGLPFTDCMKKAASAALSSPMFLYRTESTSGKTDPFELASKLSFYFWSSGPDEELLQLAADGKLAQPQVLDQAIDRMMNDPKIERFLDSFPAQWMQLENVLAATPDPKRHRLFSLEKTRPASLHMLIEPLLLFDTLFVENRPISELVVPEFTYQSEFLKTWYTSKLRPLKIDRQKIIDQNEQNDRRRADLNREIQTNEAALNKLSQPIRERILDERKKQAGQKKPVDLKPFAAWEFDGDLKASVGDLDLTAHGKIEFKDGMVVLNRSFLESRGLPKDFIAKTLDVWCVVHNLDQRGGGVMGMQGPGDFFDTIVLGERKNRHWISGSNGFSRTLDFPDSYPETEQGKPIHLTMVYQQDEMTLMYRNGQPYGKPFRKGRARFPGRSTSVIFGLRHKPAGGNKYLHVSVDKARLYDRALTAKEVAASHTGVDLYVTDEQLAKEMTPEQNEQRIQLSNAIKTAKESLAKVPANQDPVQLVRDSRNRYDNEIRTKLRAKTFRRVRAVDPRYGGVITNAAMLSMTSGPKRTHPIARGAWIIEVIFNDPPPPPPNDVPPLNEDASAKELTIREKFAAHRENPSCAGCHSRLDPLGFALENFDITGRWRDRYDNGRPVDSSGKMMRKYTFDGIVEFKQSLVTEKKRFAKAFTSHLLRFAMARELEPRDLIAVERIVDSSEDSDFKLRSLVREIARSDVFVGR